MPGDDVLGLLCCCGGLLLFMGGAVTVGLFFVKLLERGDRGGGLERLALLVDGPITPVGEVQARKKVSLLSSKAVVHRLDTAEGPAVAIVVVHRSVLSYRRTPIALTPAQADQLVALLDQARQRT